MISLCAISSHPASRTHQVKGRASLESLDLTLVEGVGELNLVLGTVLVLDGERQVLARRKGLETKDVDLVRRLDLLVVIGVDEREREHALLLQVRLVDTSERASDDGKTAEETGLESGVLTRSPHRSCGRQ